MTHHMVRMPDEYHISIEERGPGYWWGVHAGVKRYGEFYGRYLDGGFAFTRKGAERAARRWISRKQSMQWIEP